MKNERKVEYMIFPRMSALSEVLWSPQKGMHTLNLVDDTNQVLDSVNFEVRGNLKASNLHPDHKVLQTALKP